MSLSQIIDADAHITEPADLWTSRAPKKYSDRVPRVERKDGRDVWTMEGRFLIGVGHTATAGWESFPRDYPATFEDCHPAAYDAKERLLYMDANAIWAQVLYPNVAAFGAQNFLRVSDEVLKIRCVEMYNDFLQEWSAHCPDRLVGVGALPFWDVDAAVREAVRVADIGMRGLLFTGEPQRFGLPRLGDPHWDPLYSTAQELGLPVHFHVGAGEDGIDFLAGIAHSEVYLYLKNGIQCADLLMCGVLERFPDLKFVSVESGTGWLPFVLEAADRGAERFLRPGCVLPSELFARQVCYLDAGFMCISGTAIAAAKPMTCGHRKAVPDRICGCSNLRDWRLPCVQGHSLGSRRCGRSGRWALRGLSRSGK